MGRTLRRISVTSWGIYSAGVLAWYLGEGRLLPYIKGEGAVSAGLEIRVGVASVL